MGSVETGLGDGVTKDFESKPEGTTSGTFNTSGSWFQAPINSPTATPEIGFNIHFGDAGSGTLTIKMTYTRQ